MTQFTVTFQDSMNNERVIGYVSGLDAAEARRAAKRIIVKFCEDHSYKSYYTRSTLMTHRGIPETEWLDVGSWSEFFYIYPTDYETIEELIRESSKVDDLI